MTSSGAMEPLPPPLGMVRADAAEVLAALDERAQQFMVDSRAGSTWKVYATDWRLFRTWCGKHGLTAMPVETETIRRYVTSLAATHKVSTIEKKLSSISVAHEIAGVDTARTTIWAPTVTGILKGIRVEHAKIPAKRVSKKKALRTADLRKMIGGIGRENDLDVRDRALLLMMMPGAFRRSEIIQLDIADIEEVDEGLQVTLHTSKTDREGRGFVKGIPFGSHPDLCPVRAWRAWLRKYGHMDGPAFPSMDRWGHIKYGAAGIPHRPDGKNVAEMLKKRAKAAALPGNWGGHSARRGFATEAVYQDASEQAAKRQGAWKSDRVFRGYVDDADIWKNNAAMKLGL